VADIPGLRRAMKDKTGRSDRHTIRTITAKMESDLLPRDLATMAVAKDWGVALGRYVNQDDLAALRNAQAGSRSSAAPSAPVSAPAAPATRRRATPAASRPSRTSTRKKGRDVMVVHGRDEEMKDAMFAFLKALDLRPLEWTTGIRETGSANPSVQQIVDALFGKADAVVVLLTPDDEARVRPQFQEPNDPPWEKKMTGQARPNVLFEAGMAMGLHPDRTVLAQIGHVRPFSDIGGSFITHMNNTVAKRKELAIKLSAACAVDMDGEDWRTPAKGGDFEYKEKKNDG
jgi:predicted nucleotide-binding protein